MKTFKLILHAIRDRYRLNHPKKNLAKLYGYAFIVHPRNRYDVTRKYPFMRYLPNSFVDAFTRNLWPVVLSEITGLKSVKTGESIRGFVMSVPLTPAQMMADRDLAVLRINETVRLAENMGIKIVGLGALTSSFTKGGMDLIEEGNIGITTGHAYTAHTVTGYVFAVEKLFELDKSKLTVAIVGATGSVGSISARILARAGYKKIILIDLERKHPHFKDIVRDMRELAPDADIRLSANTGDVLEADFIIAATNAPEAVLNNSNVKSGAVIFDDAQPSDVAAEVLDRDDVLALEAGVISTPEIHTHFNFGLKSRTDNFCCMGEIMVLAANDWREHFVINRATLERVDRIVEASKPLGFTLGKFQNRKEIISEEKIENVKRIARANQQNV